MNRTDLHSFIAEYLDRKPVPRGIAVKRSVLAHFGAFFPEGTALEDIDRIQADRYRQYVAGLYDSGHIAGATANHRLTYVRAMFGVAIDTGRIAGPNPFANIPRFPVRRREFILPDADEPLFLRACPPWLRAMVQDNLYLGLRPEEMRNLRRGDFRPNEGAHGFICLSEARTKAGRIKAAQGRPEAFREARIALTPDLKARLIRRERAIHHDFLYLGPNGGPVRKSTLEKAFRAAAARALPEMAERRGIAPDELAEEIRRLGGFSFYTTRHTAATRDGQAGFTEDELCHKYRWSNREMVANYVHPSDEWAERAAMKRAGAVG